MSLPDAKPDTWMPTYWGDYMRDTGHLNATGHGAYLMIIKHYWCTGEAPQDDDNELWRIACCDSKKEWLKIRPKIIRLFKPRNGRWYHKRVEEELGKATEKKKKASENAKIAADARWRKSGKSDADGMLDASAKHARRNAPRMRDASGTHSERNAETMPEECPPPSPSPISSNDDDRSTPLPRAREIADAFLAIRERLWPACASLPAARMTIEAQAAQHLETGISTQELGGLIEDQCGRFLAEARGAPSSLDAFKLSLPAAIRRHLDAKRTGQPQAGGRSPPLPPDAQRRRLKAWLTAQGDPKITDKSWPADWGVPPWEPGHGFDAEAVEEFRDRYAEHGRELAAGDCGKSQGAAEA